MVKFSSTMEKEKNIQFISQKREEIELYLPDGRIISGKRGSTIGDLFSLLGEWEGAPIVGAVVDGNLRELSYNVIRDCKITPINMTTSDGSKIYRRSLTFLLETSYHEMFPKAFLAIDHSVPNGGYYCKVIDREPLNENEIADLEKHMQRLVSEDLTIFKEKVPLE